LQRTATVGLLLAGEILAVVTLHRLGRVDDLTVPYGDLGRWLSNSEPEVVLVALGRVSALVLAWWLLGSTTLYALAHALRREALTAAVGVLTLPAARRVLDRAVAGAVLATVLMARVPAASAGPAPGEPITVEPRTGRLDPKRGPGPEEVRVGRTVPLPELPTTTTAPAAPPPPPPTPVEPAPSEDRTADAPRSVADPTPLPLSGVYVVRAGDNLWTIAARAASGPAASTDPSDSEIASYWNALIERNRARLQSGDPNLIYPGEILELP
jgi:nucleoid-associated protein YgaU